MLRSISLFIAALFLLSSCEKEEKALILPPTGTSSHDVVNMGNDYARQIFYDFETKSIVSTSDQAMWDLAFEASADGRHVYMNGGAGVQIYNTHKTAMQQVTTLPDSCKSPNSLGWTKYDDPSGLPDQTGVGEWMAAAGYTKGEVYIVMTGSTTKSYQKVRFLSVDNSKYVLEWSALADIATPTTVQVEKDSNYSFVYLSFRNGTVKPDPPKNTWDVVFTRYRFIFRNYLNQGFDFGYDVTGALLNPYKTIASADSITGFSSIDLPKAMAMATTNHRDIIGYDWKQYDFGTTHYSVNRAKCYVLHTRNEQLFKLHFLEFYNSAGEKGNPAFEFERLK